MNAPGAVASRLSLPADLVGSVRVLKELYDLSDAQTAEVLRFDIRWKVACGRSLTPMSLDPSTLVYWRGRVAVSQRPNRVFDAVAAVIAVRSLPSTQRADELVGWLDPRHRQPCRLLLTEGHRIAQEAVGLAYLTATSDWRNV